MAIKSRGFFEKLLLDRLFNISPKVSEEEVVYFRSHPDQIDEISAPANLHQMYLALCFLAGIFLFTLSKAISHFDWLSSLHPLFQEFFIDLFSEISTALMGAAIVTYVLVIVLNKQQKVARAWRRELHERIRQK